MVLEMMQGGELFDRIRKKISFTEKEASEITSQVTCSAANRFLNTFSTFLNLLAVLLLKFYFKLTYFWPVLDFLLFIEIIILSCNELKQRSEVHHPS